MIQWTPLQSLVAYDTVHTFAIISAIWYSAQSSVPVALCPCFLQAGDCTICSPVIRIQLWTCNTSQMPWTLTLCVCHTPSKIVCSICCWFCELFSKFSVSLQFNTVHFPCSNFHACPLLSGCFASWFVGSWAILLYVGSIDTLTCSMNRLHFLSQNVALFTSVSELFEAAIYWWHVTLRFKY
jgi:hypothetical protein